VFLERIYPRKKSKLYSGLFILPKHRRQLASKVIAEIITRAHSLLGEELWRYPDSCLEITSKDN